MFEDVTRLVSLMDIFSRNENFKEVQTDHLKYFLLPVILGDLNARCILTGRDRGDIVETCQIYYIDFLQRMVDYEFTEVNVPKVKSLAVDESEEESSSSNVRSGMPNLSKMNNEREAMMARFRETKELESEIKTLKSLVSPGTRDEDLERKLYISMIKRFINFAIDEVQSLHREVDILRHMAAIKAGKAEPEPEKKSRPFKPIIITKDYRRKCMGLATPVCQCCLWMNSTSSGSRKAGFPLVVDNLTHSRTEPPTLRRRSSWKRSTCVRRTTKLIEMTKRRL